MYWDADEGRRAVRVGDWKWVENDGVVELFDLGKDVSEKVNLAGKHPEGEGVTSAVCGVAQGDEAANSEERMIRRPVQDASRKARSLPSLG